MFFPYILPFNFHDVLFVVAAAVGCISGSSCVTGEGDGLPFGQGTWQVNVGACTVSQRLLRAVASVLFDCCAAPSILSCVFVDDAVFFLDAVTLFLLLLMTCLLTILALARLSLAVGGVCGPA